MITRLKTFLIECRRVFKVARKPTRQELITMIKVTGIGMLVIGAIGFVIYLFAKGLIQPLFAS